MRRKIGDRVLIKSKYFNQFNDLEGEVIEIDDCYQKITVNMDYDKGRQVFDKNELKGINNAKNR
jgi:hypothetical protein